MRLPGGCELGPRPIDLHLEAIRALGGHCRGDGGGLLPRRALRGRTSCSPAPVWAPRRMPCWLLWQPTALRYYHQRRPGAGDRGSPGFPACHRGRSVQGAGTSMVVTVEGGAPSTAGSMPSWETGSWPVLIWPQLPPPAGTSRHGGGPPPPVHGHRRAAEAGCDVHERGRSPLPPPAGGPPPGGCRPVRTAPYPGFPTDAQPPLMAALARGEGTTVLCGEYL